MLSIFATKAEARQWAKKVNVGRPKHERLGVPQRPLQPATHKRMAGGLHKHVLLAGETERGPFVLSIENYGWNASGTRSALEPLSTVTANPRGGKHAVVDIGAAAFTSTLNHGGDEHRSQDFRDPISTVTGARDARATVGALLSPFIASPAHSKTTGRGRYHDSVDAPLKTITASNDKCLMAVHLDSYHGAKGNESRSQPVTESLRTLDTQNRFGVVAAHLLKFRSDNIGNSLNDPMPTVTSGAGAARDAGVAHALGLSACYLSHMYSSNTNGGQGDPRQPLKTVTSGGQHSNICAVYLQPFYGRGSGQTGHSPAAPLPTVSSKDRFAHIAVEATPHWVFPLKIFSRIRQVGRWAKKMLGAKVKDYLMWVEDAETGEKFPLLFMRLRGVIHLITDIVMRMLQPRELARRKDFPIPTSLIEPQMASN